MRTSTQQTIAATLAFAMAFTFNACSSDGGGGSSSTVKKYGSMTDSRDGKAYKTTTIDTQTWLAENLNYNAEGSVCYNNQESNCTKYGRLYNWVTAMDGATSSTANPSGVQGVCPSGWHLPSSAEWETLIDYAGGYSTAGTKLKETSGWNNYEGSSGNGTDDYLFSSLPGGYGTSSPDGNSFRTIGNFGLWWSSTEDGYDASLAYIRGMYNDVAYVGYDDGYDGAKEGLFSVRCVKDND